MVAGRPSWSGTAPGVMAGSRGGDGKMDTAEAVDAHEGGVPQVRQRMQRRHLVGERPRVDSATLAVRPALDHMDPRLASPAAGTSLDLFAGHSDLLFHGNGFWNASGHSTKA